MHTCSISTHPLDENKYSNSVYNNNHPVLYMHQGISTFSAFIILAAARNSHLGHCNCAFPIPFLVLYYPQSNVASEHSTTSKQLLLPTQQHNAECQVDKGSRLCTIFFFHEYHQRSYSTHHQYSTNLLLLCKKIFLFYLSPVFLFPY